MRSAFRCPNCGTPTDYERVPWRCPYCSDLAIALATIGEFFRRFS